MLPRKKEAQASASAIAGGLSFPPPSSGRAYFRAHWAVPRYAIHAMRSDANEGAGIITQASKGCHRLLAGAELALSLSAQGTLAGRDGRCRARSGRSAQRRRERLLLRGSRGRPQERKRVRGALDGGRAQQACSTAFRSASRTTFSSPACPRGSDRRLTSDAPSTHDAPAVARLREQGAIVIGKTAMPEFGWKAVTDSPLTGVTRNPWDTRKTPGGSSGGAVAAVVLGMGNIHLGTDGGGSIRIPAAFGGSYGIKPTRARVPAWPASPLGTLAHVGLPDAIGRRCGAGAHHHGRSRPARRLRLDVARARLSGRPRRRRRRHAGRVLAAPRIRQARRAERSRRR